MEFMYAQIDLNSYVAKYVDEMGCSLEEACRELGIEISNIFKPEEKNNY
jgi:hypothetical protein